MNEDSSTISDLQSLLGVGSGGSTSLIDTAPIIEALMPIVIILTIVSIVVALLYIVGIVHSIRVSKATIETRDILREMNERDKLRDTHGATSTPVVAPIDTQSKASLNNET